MNIKKIIQLAIIICLMGVIGCNSNTQTNNADYLICNKTSNGKMAEIENGYFYAYGGLLYYADKENIEQWVPVCNKPDCIHVYTGLLCKCNAYLPTYNTIWQKDDGLYGISVGVFEENIPYVYEITTDGSGRKKVYEISLEDGVNPREYSFTLYQDKFILQYNYLDEEGLYQNNVICLMNDQDGNVIQSTLHEGIEPAPIVSGNSYWSLRGECLFTIPLYAEEGADWSKNICKTDGEKIIPLNLPEDISFARGHLNDDIFTYYQPQEGFYQYNITTGERTLIFENQLEDGRGYILTDNCMVECNRYQDYMPDKAYLKVYNGKEWIDVELLEELTNSDDAFYPVSVTSDRIFFRKSIEGMFYLYYLMLDDNEPKLVSAGKIGKEPEVYLEDETIAEDIFSSFTEEIIFDTNEYLFKITDVYVDKKNRCCIDFYFENRSEDDTYWIWGNHGSINGIQCDTNWGMSASPNEIQNHTLCLEDDIIKPSRLSKFYTVSEYTDIEFGFHISNNENSQEEEKYVHIYPQGEEKAIKFKGETKDTDIILVDNEIVSVIVTGFEETLVPGDTINVLIENKTEQLLFVTVENATGNGFAIDPFPIYGVYHTFVNPGATSMYPMTFFDKVIDGPFSPSPNGEFFIENGITSIEEIEMQLKVYYYSLLEGKKKENFVDKTFTLNP